MEEVKTKKKLKFKELSKFWKGMVVSLTFSTLAFFLMAIAYFVIYIYPLFNLMGW